MVANEHCVRNVFRPASGKWSMEFLDMLHAAQNGHLEVLKWARENGCNWNKQYCLNVSELIVSGNICMDFC